ncbi:hypothetical protein L195_g064517, partial [Trifolium pratense]
AQSVLEGRLPRMRRRLLAHREDRFLESLACCCHAPVTDWCRTLAGEAIDSTAKIIPVS